MRGPPRWHIVISMHTLPSLFIKGQIPDGSLIGAVDLADSPSVLLMPKECVLATPAATDGLLVKGEQRDAVKRYVERYYVKFSDSTWINPRGLRTLAVYGDRVIVRNRLFSKVTVRDCKPSQIEAFVRVAGLTRYSATGYVSLAEVFSYHPATGAAVRHGKRFQVANPYRAAVEAVIDVSDWAGRRDGSWVNPGQMQIIDQGQIVYGFHHCLYFHHSIGDLTLPGFARVMRLPWFKAGERLAINLEKIERLEHGNDTPFCQLPATVHLANFVFTQVPYDHIMGLIAQAKPSPETMRRWGFEFKSLGSSSE